MVKQVFAAGVQPDSPALARKKCRAEVLFKPGNALADGRLRYAKLFGSRCHVFVFRHGLEVPQLQQFQAFHPLIMFVLCSD